MEKSIFVVPTYWCREEPRKDDLIYDHPTPLNEEGTLERLIDSLNILEIDDIQLIIISVPNFKDEKNLVKKKVDGIISKFSNLYTIYHFSFYSLLKFYHIFSKNNRSHYQLYLSLNGYSNVRNCCIFLPNILNKDIAILIDDDEIFEDPKFLEKAKKFVSPQIPGKAGYYIQSHGNYKFKVDTPWYRRFWDNARKMNESFEIIDSGERLKETPFVFGGNMVIHRELFMNIPFDPYIRRGEDISYLYDAKNEGYKFPLDRELSIKHLPPETSISEYIKIREDIYRFVYMRQKLKNMNFDINKTKPYPGYFLQWDLPIKIGLTSSLYSLNSLLTLDISGSIEYLKNIVYMFDAYFNSRNWICEYRDFKKNWPEFMHWIFKNRAVFNEILENMKL